MEEAEENGKLQLFRIGLRAHFKTFASTVGQEKFLELYQNVVNQNRKVKGPKLYTIFQGILLQAMMDCSEKFFQESKIDEKLNEALHILDNSIVMENGETWRPPGNVEQQMMSYNVSDQESINQQYEDFLHRKIAVVQCLMNEILCKRTEIENIKRVIVNCGHDIETLDCVNAELVPNIECAIQKTYSS